MIRNLSPSPPDLWAAAPFSRGPPDLQTARRPKVARLTRHRPGPAELSLSPRDKRLASPVAGLQRGCWWWFCLETSWGHGVTPKPRNHSSIGGGQKQITNPPPRGTRRDGVRFARQDERLSAMTATKMEWARWEFELAFGSRASRDNFAGGNDGDGRMWRQERVRCQWAENGYLLLRL
ncbi:hypothetical protein Cob_v007734 [Colletotrichum orbiculare MAFF 240422]|uniref:Uncharacterized protein n=1 Tax=Colletotrichum orbiculare (strain 104-T / ATCC 96160 / CBS 514.97 / LARS 414 / MAFF 240422) TaxID=1213857 RepID=A0A484FR76_COLOR|nr:hypothetical protein Cob_v007734 [Colletotrichum orbiculare MAFF 240422]